MGETGRNAGPPGRREIGHGKLAWRPAGGSASGDDFPYTIRLRLRDHGIERLVLDGDRVWRLVSVDDGRRVPLKAPVAGVAMGLILQDDGQYAVLT